MKFVISDEKRHLSGIYQIRNIETDGVYVGQTKESFLRRFYLHQWKLRQGTHDNSHLQRSWNKYGDDKFVFDIVEIVPDDLLDEREQYWIMYYRTTSKCYNIQDGGQPKRLVQYVSAEGRKIVGEKNRQRMLGSHLSEATKKKMSERRKGKRCNHSRQVISEDQAKKIKLLLMNGVPTRDIMEQLNIPYRPINNILSSNSWSTAYVEGWDEFYRNRPRHKGRQPKPEHEIQRVRELHSMGYSNNYISKDVGWDPQTIKRYLSL